MAAHTFLAGGLWLDQTSPCTRALREHNIKIESKIVLSTRLSCYQIQLFS